MSASPLARPVSATVKPATTDGSHTVSLFVCLSFWVFDGFSVCLLACLLACLSVCLSLWFGKACHCETCTRSVCMFVCLFWYLIVCLPTCLLVCLSVCRCGSARPVTVEPATTDGSHTVSLFVCLSFLVFDGVSVCLPTFLPVCLSVCLWLWFGKACHCETCNHRLFVCPSFLKLFF